MSVHLCYYLRMGHKPDSGSSYRDHIPRKGARVSLPAEVQLRRSGQRYYRVSHGDLSQEGCKVEFVDRPRLDEMMWVKFEGYDAIEAHVRWIDAPWVGLQFERPLHIAVFEALVQRLR